MLHVFSREPKAGTATDLLFSAAEDTYAFSSVVPASAKCTERTVYTVIQSHSSCPIIMPGFIPEMSPFSSGIAGSLSSSLHENYSMGELKECGVHSVEQLAERHIHSLATQRVQEVQEKWKASRD